MLSSIQSPATVASQPSRTASGYVISIAHPTEPETDDRL